MLGEVNTNFNWHGVSSKNSTEEACGMKRGQGGVAIFWDKGLKGVSVIETIKHDRVCGIRMEGSDDTALAFISVYLPASSSNENLSVTLDELSGIIGNLGDNVVPIIGGDFNGDMGTTGGPRGRGTPTKQGTMVKNFMEDNNLSAVNMMNCAVGNVNTYEGHNGESTIDYLMVPKYLGPNVRYCRTGSNQPINTSDHLPVEMKLELNLLPRQIGTESNNTKLRWDKLEQAGLTVTYSTTLNEYLYNIIETFNSQDIVTPGHIDDALDEVVRTLHKAAEIVPKSKFVKRLKPYWCGELNNLKKEKMKWFTKWKEQGRTINENDPVRKRMKETKKSFSRRIRQLSREYHNHMVAEAAQKAEFKREDFWKLMNSLNNKGKSSYNAITNKQGKVVYELNDVLNVWRNHFDALSTPRNDPMFNEANYTHVTENVHNWTTGNDTSIFLENPFTKAEVLKVISKLNSGKVPGHDGISSEHLKYAGEFVAHVLCIIFNACVEIEYIPCNFRRGIQVPLYKGKNTCPLDPDNYRGITLLLTFNKMFEAIIWGRIEEWWVSSHATSVLQGAARKGYSCVHTALTLQETIAKEREGGKRSS